MLGVRVRVAAAAAAAARRIRVLQSVGRVRLRGRAAFVRERHEALVPDERARRSLRRFSRPVARDAEKRLVPIDMINSKKSNGSDIPVRRTARGARSARVRSPAVRSRTHDLSTQRGLARTKTMSRQQQPRRSTHMPSVPPPSSAADDDGASTVDARCFLSSLSRSLRPFARSVGSRSASRRRSHIWR